MRRPAAAVLLVLILSASAAAQAPAHIAGTVIDIATGMAATGDISATLYDAADAYVATVDVDLSGMFDVGVAPGTYFLLVSGEFYAPQVYQGLPCAAADCRPRNGTPIAATAGGTTTIAVVMTPAGSISGTVRRASDGSPIIGELLTLYTSQGSQVATTTTGWQGIYFFTNLPAGRYYVKAVPDFSSLRLLPKIYGGDECPTVALSASCRLTSGTLIDVAAGSQAAGIDFSLRAPGSITGHVTSDDTSPIPGVDVQALVNDVVMATGRTGSDGRFDIGELPPGTYHLRTSASGYVDEWFGGQPADTGLATVGVTVAGDTVTSGVDFVLTADSDQVPPRGSIRGTVTHDLDDFHYGGGGLQVAAYDAAGRQVQTVTIVSPSFQHIASFAYELSGLAPGRYYVRTVSRAYVGTSPNFFSGGALVDLVYPNLPCATVDCDVRRGTPVVVSAGAATEHVDFHAVTGGRIFNVTRDARLYDARGVLVSPSRRRNASGLFNDGPFDYIGLPAGTYYLALPDGRLNGTLACPACPATAATPLVVGLGERVDAQLPSPGSGSISGVIRLDGPLTPLSTIRVEARTRAGILAASGLTDQLGLYQLTGLLDGDYYVLATDDLAHVDQLYPNLPCEGCDLAAGTPVTVAGGDTGGIDFVLPRAAVVTGTVRDAAGVALPNTTVTLLDPGSAVAARTVTDQAGAFAFEVPGGVTYRARTEPRRGYAVRTFDDLPCTATGGCDGPGGTMFTPTVAMPVTGIDFSLPACSGITLSPTLLALGAAGDAYRQRFTATGGVPPYRFRLVDGMLPDGLVLDPAGGLLSGAPTSTGTYDLRIGVVDATGCGDVRDYSLHIAACSFVLTPASAVAGTAGGPITIDILDGCGNASVSSTATWIHVQSATASRVTLQVDDNTSPGAVVRQANVIIGRRIFPLRQAAPDSTAPFGVLDAPANGAIVTGSLAVGGWALDDLGVQRVALYREAVAGETGWIYLGDAVFVEGARPDVAALYPTAPHAERAGWGYMLLTNQLPDQGNGVTVLHAVAFDVEGHQTVLGTRVITATNATATAPFGTLDTPSQGETVGGAAYVNFGWALTPQPKTIPFDGSTITVFVDGEPLGSPVYNLFRADVAGLFPGLNNSSGPVGYRLIDTTTLADGLHTIAWTVTDDAGAPKRDRQPLLHGQQRH